MLSPVSRRATLVVALVAVLIGVPVAVFASHQFSDVPTGYLFHNDIDAVADAGVTSGCGGGKYCPESFVTRGQMAAFMNRLGALASDKPPVVNADRVDGYHANATTRVAYNAASATVTGTQVAGRITATITAPSRGWIIISGSGYIYNESTELIAHATCWVEVNQNVLAGSTRGIDTDYRSAGPRIDEQVCATNGGFEVCTAGTYPVDLEFVLDSTSLDVLYSSVTAQYSPFGGAGQQPSCTSSAPTSSVQLPEKDAD